MFSSILIFVLIVIFLGILIFYKREMLLNVFSLNVASSANKFQEQLEEAADVIIQRLEERIIYLEEMLETADLKIIGLDEKIKIVNKLLEKETRDSTEILSQSMTNSSNFKSEETTVNNEKLNHMTVPLQEGNILGIDKFKEVARNNKRESVLALADQGHNSVEIAKITGISKSEIILLMQLNKRQK